MLGSGRESEREKEREREGKREPESAPHPLAPFTSAVPMNSSSKSGGGSGGNGSSDGWRARWLAAPGLAEALSAEKYKKRNEKYRWMGKIPLQCRKKQLSPEKYFACEKQKSPLTFQCQNKSFQCREIPSSPYKALTALEGLKGLYRPCKSLIRLLEPYKALRAL